MTDLAVVDPESLDAQWAMAQYFAELDARFDGGFDPGDALADARAYQPPTGAFVLAAERSGCGAVVRVDDERAEIKRMWVAPAARGRGLGRRLLLRLEDEARALGATTVILDTNGVLTEAIAMYTAAGYRAIERYNDNPYAQHWFAKSLHRLPSRIEGDGVVLERFAPAHVEEHAAAFAASEAELRRWMPHASAEQEDSASFAGAAERAFDAGQTYPYAVTVGGEVVGYCNLTPADDGAEAEIGYWVRTDRTRAGIGARAIDALVTAAFATLPALRCVAADVHSDNVASRRLLAKCGFEGDGPTLRRHAARSISDQGDQGVA